MNKKKLIPVFVMLVAGAIAGILMMTGGYKLDTLLKNLLLVLIVFYVMGCVLKYILEHCMPEEEKDYLDEGEVIEKQSEVNE